jgi:hypothetical protein
VTTRGKDAKRIVLAIDPGPEKSAWVLYNRVGIIADKGYDDSGYLARQIEQGEFRADAIAIEMIASYGMPVGAEVFETCVWIGKMEWAALRSYGRPHRVFRKDVKLHLCGSVKAKDGNVRQALMDRFGGSKCKGTKKNPGPLFGVSGDIWSALAVAVTFAGQGEGGKE